MNAIVRPSTLKALTAAALCLPGLFQSTVVQAAAEEEASFGYGHYQEGRRNLYLSLLKLTVCWVVVILI